MALQTQLVELPFQSGISEKTYPAHVQAGSQTSVINGVFAKGGTIQKRNGYAALSLNVLGGGTLSDVRGLTSLGTGLVAADPTNGKVYSYVPTLGKWNAIDKIGECNAWREGVEQWTSATSSFDCAYGNGYLVVVWTALPRTAALNTVYASVIDWSNGNYVFSSYEVATSATQDYTYARVIVQGTTAIVVYKDGTTTTDVYARSLDMSTMAWDGGATKIVSDYDTTSTDQGFWDIAPIVGGTQWVILYPYKSGPSKASIIRKLSTTLTVVASTTTFGPPGGFLCPGHGYAVYADTTLIWAAIVYDDGANETVYASTWTTTSMAAALAETSTTMTFTGTPKVKIAVGPTGTGDALIIGSTNVTSAAAQYNYMTALGAVGMVHKINGCALEGKPFNVSGRTYCMLGSLWNLVAYTGTPPTTVSSGQGAYILFELNETVATAGYTYVARPVANLAPRIANTTNVGLQAMTSTTGCWAISSYPAKFITLGSVVTSTSNRFGLQAFTFDFGGDRFSGPELGTARYLAGGLPSMFDGRSVTELGFLHPPPTVTLAEAAGGSLTVGGAYTYLVLYTWPDANGNIQRSASSIASGTLGAGKQKYTLTITNCAFTARQDPDNKYSPPIGIQVYRNTSNGATFYQLFNDANVLVSDPNSYSQSYTDTMSDVTLAGLGYGTWPYSGGALEGYCPPAMQKIVAYNLRLWGIGDDRQSLWYSSRLLEAETPRFSDSWRMAIGETIVGLEVMDNALYVFTETGILRIAGAGPSEENTQNDLQGPDIVASDAGCIESRSILTTPLGIFFQAPAGIYLLTRGGGEVVFVGQAVEDTLNAYPLIRAANLHPAKTEVRFECAVSDTSAVGVTLVYNYTFKAWSVFQKYHSRSSACAYAAAVVDDVYYWSGGLGQVYQESATSYFDGTPSTATWVTLSVESAWARAGAIQGWGRFRYVNVLAESMDPHDLTISVANDFSDTYTQTHTFHADEIARWTTPMEAGEVQIGRQKAAAVRVKISDAPPTHAAYTSGQGPILVGLQLEVGVMPRPYRLPPAQGA